MPEAANSLVATPESGALLSGAGILDDAESLVKAIQDGDWVSGGLATFTAAVDALSMALSPIAALTGWVAAWFLDHADPLRSWLNDLTGDSSQVEAASQTWSNIGAFVDEMSSGMTSQIKELLSDQCGATVDTFRQFGGEAADLISAAGKLAGAISVGLNIAAMIVRIVHDLIRDAISDLIGKGFEAFIEAVASGGILMPKVIADVAIAVTKWSEKLRNTVANVVRSMDKLSALFNLASKTDKEILTALDRFTDVAQTASTILGSFTEAVHDAR